MSPFLSVIIPIYNAASHLRRCLDSIEGQSYRDFELLLIDDGSTDDSFSICEEYAQQDSRIRLFHMVHAGVSGARNYGLEQAQGEFVCWIDADDAVSSEYLSDLVNCVDSNTDLVIQSLYRYESSEVHQVRGVAPGQYHLSDDADQSAFFSSVNLDHFGVSFSKLFRLSTIRQHALAYNGNLSLAEDLDFLFRYLCLCRNVTVTDHANYHYYIRQGSASTSIYDFDVESRGMRQISSSCNRLYSCFSIPQVERLRGLTIAAYIHRVLISCYKPQYTRSQRFDFIRSITSPESETYKQYGPKQTAFLRSMNSLFVNHHYLLFDLLMIFVYRYRHPLL